MFSSEHRVASNRTLRRCRLAPCFSCMLNPVNWADVYWDLKGVKRIYHLREVALVSPTKGPLAVPADPTAAPDHQASTASNNRVVNQPHLNPVRNMYVVILIYIRHMTTFYIIIFLERLLFYCLTLIIIMIRIIIVVIIIRQNLNPVTGLGWVTLHPPQHHSVHTQKPSVPWISAASIWDRMWCK